MSTKRRAGLGDRDPDAERVASGRGSPPPDLAWLEPRFALGSRPYADQRRAVARQGIDTVISLHEPQPGEREGWAAVGVDFVSFPTRDWVEIPAARFSTVAEEILARLSAGRTVLVHCLAGVNRAPTVAAAVLCYRDGLTPEQAIEAVRACRPAAAPTPEQVASLRAWLKRHHSLSRKPSS